MSQAVPIILTPQEKDFLLDCARLSIEHGLRGLLPGKADMPSQPSGALLQPMGAFVTLSLRQGQRSALRGCIGMMRAEKPLAQTVCDMARAAAFHDPRFHPLSSDEWPKVELEISILGPLSLCPDLARVVLGRHGLLLLARGRQAVFLPQVPVEQGWTLDDTLVQLCHKAGLPSDAWRDGDARIFWYESLILSPGHPEYPSEKR